MEAHARKTIYKYRHFHKRKPLKHNKVHINKAWKPMLEKLYTNTDTFIRRNHKNITKCILTKHRYLVPSELHNYQTHQSSEQEPGA